MSESKKQQIEEIKSRFKPLTSGLFEYKVSFPEKEDIQIKEVLKIAVIETQPGKPEITVRVVSTLYQNDNGDPEVFYLPVNEISPEFDLKNTLVNLFIATLDSIRDSLIESPIDKPGVQNYLILKLLFLLDHPRICYLFLKGGQKDFRDYKLVEELETNARLVNIISHNIGGFLKDVTVKKTYKEIGRENTLDEWYNYLAEAKLDFLYRTKALPEAKRSDDLNTFKKWFAQRYDMLRIWKALEPWHFIPGWSMVLIIIIALLSGISCFFIENRLLQCIPFITLLVMFGMMKFNPRKWFEMLFPRLFIGVIIGCAFFIMASELWAYALSCYFKNWKPVIISILSYIFIFLYLYTKLKNEQIGDGRLSRSLRCVCILCYLSFLGVIVTWVMSFLFSRFIYLYVNDQTPTLLQKSFSTREFFSIPYEFNNHFMLLCMNFSVFAGIFFQLFWQEEKITEPI